MDKSVLTAASSAFDTLQLLADFRTNAPTGTQVRGEYIYGRPWGETNRQLVACQLYVDLGDDKSLEICKHYLPVGCPDLEWEITAREPYADPERPRISYAETNVNGLDNGDLLAVVYGMCRTPGKRDECNSHRRGNNDDLFHVSQLLKQAAETYNFSAVA